MNLGDKTEINLGLFNTCVSTILGIHKEVVTDLNFSKRKYCHHSPPASRKGWSRFQTTNRQAA